MSRSTVQSRLAETRKSRGVGATELAKAVGVSRQTIYAIEAGTYVPNTEVALQLARALEVGVDDLFSLRAVEGNEPDAVVAEVLSTARVEKGQSVRLCQVGSKWVSIPVPATPYFMPEADGVVRRSVTRGRVELTVFAKDDASQKRLLLAGCDPATGLLSRMVERATGIEVVSAPGSSKLALQWLREGKVHIAGSHLEDPGSGEFNLPYIREQFPGEDIVVITFARWEEGIVVAPGNRKNIRTVADLSHRGVRFVNRELGSGSRALLDNQLKAAGMSRQRVNGYDRVAFGHLPAAYHVFAGEADACIATRSAAQTFGLGFVPLHSARYDLVLRKRTGELPAVKVFLDVLHRASLRRKLEVLAGYDTSQTGTQLVV